MAGFELYNLQGKRVGELACPKTLLEGQAESGVVWQAVRMYLANKRQGTADTKTRGEVRGGGRKPWAQKHTGRARAGSIRSPIWRKGGIVFGPHPRDFRYQLPAKVRRKALLESLKSRVSIPGAVIGVETLESLPAKTKTLAKLIEQVGAKEKVLLVVDRSNPVLTRAARNLERLTIKPAAEVTCYDLLSHPQMVVTPSGWEELNKRVA